RGATGYRCRRFLPAAFGAHRLSLRSLERRGESARAVRRHRLQHGGRATRCLVSIQGPDPSRGNFVGGLNLNATTDNWTIGLSYDFVRGSNNATEQSGVISLLGRI